jgi:lipoic acid synthetase
MTRRIRDARCGYDQSLQVLAWAKERAPERLTKSSIMVGIGESDAEVEETLRDLRDAGVDVVTIGQYLRPTPRHAEVKRFVTPETFDAYREMALDLGFLFCASGPLVRSSYKAAEVFIRSMLHAEDAAATPEQVEGMIEERVAAAREAARRLTQSAEHTTEAHLAAEVIPVTSLTRRRPT